MQTDNQTVLQLFMKMLYARLLEEKINFLIENSIISAPIKFALGQESILGAVEALKSDDPVFYSSRNLGLLCARNIDTYSVLMELLGSDKGLCGGKSGQSTICDVSNGFYGASYLPCLNLPLACGAAFSMKTDAQDSVVMVVLGEGASENGVFFECLNIASLKKLPIIFFVENNAYCGALKSEDASIQKDVAYKGKSYLMPSIIVDGINIMDVYEATKRARAHILNGKGPVLIESKTYRLSPADSKDKQDYRTNEEIEEHTKDCPLNFLSNFMLSNSIGTKDDIIMLKQKVSNDLDLVFKRALLDSGLAYVSQDETEKADKKVGDEALNGEGESI